MHTVIETPAYLAAAKESGMMDGDDIPVFLLTVFAKGERVNLTKAERNSLKQQTKKIYESYRQRLNQIRWSR